jgi:hypothetical protein
MMVRLWNELCVDVWLRIDGGDDDTDFPRSDPNDVVFVALKIDDLRSINHVLGERATLL